MQLRRCTSIFILFLCSLVASCGESETAVVPTDGAAGQVRELRGTVTATRAGQKPRILAEADTVFVNDSLHTADDASVVILFAHNNARWQLGSGYQGKVVDSLAWRAKRHEASALVRNEHTQTAAAGRDSEREAAESVETLEIAPLARALDEPEPTATEEKKREGGSPGASAPEPSAPTKAKRDKKPIRGRGYQRPKQHQRPKRRTSTLLTPAPPSPMPRPIPATESIGQGGFDDFGKGGLGSKGGRRNEKIGSGVGKSPGASAKTADTTETSPKRDDASSKMNLINQFNRVGNTCFKKFPQNSAAKVQISISVKNSQLKKITVAAGGNLTKTKACIEQKLKSASYRGSFSHTITITLKLAQ